MFSLNDYVVGANGIYHSEGNIIEMHQSEGTRKGMLYGIDQAGVVNYYFEEEIRPLVMPSVYEHSLMMMAQEHYYLSGDKRLARVNIWSRPYTITRDGDSITLKARAYNKDYAYTTTFDAILEGFMHKSYKDYAHIKK